MFAIGETVLGQTRLVKARRSRIHGRGLFARRDIPEGERIIEYTGEKITKAEGNRRYDEQAKNNQIYLFELNSRHDIDGSARGNIAKYANHSCDPNAETIVEKGEIWLIALQDIQKGEEITFDYNFPLYDHEKRPCRCGSENCRDWIINLDSYYYLRRKKKQAAKKGEGKKAAKSSTKTVKKTASRNGAQAGTARKAPVKTGKKTAKKGTTHSKKSGAGKKATKSSKRTGKTGKKTAKRSGKKTARNASKKSGQSKPGKKAPKKAAKKSKSGKKRAGKKRAGKSGAKGAKRSR